MGACNGCNKQTTDWCTNSDGIRFGPNIVNHKVKKVSLRFSI